MINHKLLVERILEIVRCEPQCDLDELILSCGDFPWYEVWREIAHLQRVGNVSITAKAGQYIVRSSSEIRGTRTVRRERPRLRRSARAGASTLNASPVHKSWTFAPQPRWNSKDP